MFIFTLWQFKVTRDEVVSMIVASIKAFYRFRRMGNMYVDINKFGFVVMFWQELTENPNLASKIAKR